MVFFLTLIIQPAYSKNNVEQSYRPLKAAYLTITTDPPDSVVYMEEIKMRAPVKRREFYPGTYNIIIKKKGFKNYKTTIFLNKGEDLIIPTIKLIQKLTKKEAIKIKKKAREYKKQLQIGIGLGQSGRTIKKENFESFFTEHDIAPFFIGVRLSPLLAIQSELSYGKGKSGSSKKVSKGGFSTTVNEIKYETIVVSYLAKIYFTKRNIYIAPEIGKSFGKQTQLKLVLTKIEPVKTKLYQVFYGLRAGWEFFSTQRSHHAFNIFFGIRKYADIYSSNGDHPIYGGLGWIIRY